MINQRQGVATRQSLNRPRIGNRRFSSERHLGLKQQQVAFAETDTVEPVRPRPIISKVQKQRLFDPTMGKKGRWIVKPTFATLNIDECTADSCYFTPTFEQFRRKDTVKPMAIEPPMATKRQPPTRQPKQKPLHLHKAPQTRADGLNYKPLNEHAAQTVARMTCKPTRKEQ